MRRPITVLLVCLIASTLTTSSMAAAATDEFYKNKVIRIVVGFSAGGGFDTYARSLSRYIGKYIPGNPTVIVENMPGAGSLISANHIYRVAKPDGLTIGAFNGNQILGQLLGAQGTWSGWARPVTTTTYVCSIRRPVLTRRNIGSQLRHH